MAEVKVSWLDLKSQAVEVKVTALDLKSEAVDVKVTWVDLETQPVDVKVSFLAMSLLIADPEFERRRKRKKRKRKQPEVTNASAQELRLKSQELMPWLFEEIETVKVPSLRSTQSQPIKVRKRRENDEALLLFVL